MAGDRKTGAPVYQQIAIDMATKISNGKFRPGERISGRSTMAGHYNVSPETIRRAVSILEDAGVVAARPQAGIEILSRDKAVELVHKFRDIEALTAIKNNICELLQSITRQQIELQENVRLLIESSERYKTLNPFMPFELQIAPGSLVVGQSLSSARFWNNTGATIIGIKRGEETILSPGPNTELRARDILVFIGDDETYFRTSSFLSRTAEE